MCVLNYITPNFSFGSLESLGRLVEPIVLKTLPLLYNMFIDCKILKIRYTVDFCQYFVLTLCLNYNVGYHY